MAGQLAFGQTEDTRIWRVPGLIPRQYQLDCLTAIKTAHADGCRRQLITMATGLGKTVVGAQLPGTLGLAPMLWLAHRKELLTQAQEHLRRANPLLNVEIEQADRHADRDADIVVASTATLGREQGRRIQKFIGGFGLVVIDEAHRGTTNTALRIINHFGAGVGDGPTLIGFTATGFRGDRTPLANLFDRVVFDLPLRQAIEQGHLCRLRAVRVRSRTDLSTVHSRAGDFAEDELAERINTDERNSLLCSAIEQHAADRASILIFCVNVAHVEDTTAQLQARGHRAECVTGQTPDNERWRIIERFRSGETRMLVNCNVFTEGTDIPNIDCIVFGRPTKSRLWYIQAGGRGTRKSPETGKENCLLIDVVDVCGRHRIETTATMFGMREIDLLGRDVVEAAESYEAAERQGATPEAGQSIEDVEEQARRLLAKRTRRIQTVATEVDPFAGGGLTEDVQRRSQFPWIEVSTEKYVLEVDREHHFRLIRRDGVWRLRRPSGDWWACSTGKTPSWSAVDADVKASAGHCTMRDGAQVPWWRIIRNAAKWRRDPATGAQLAALRKWKVAPPKALTKGVARTILQTMIWRAREKSVVEHKSA